jgi:hypothetical protein
VGLEFDESLVNMLQPVTNLVKNRAHLLKTGRTEAKRILRLTHDYSILLDMRLVGRN